MTYVQCRQCNNLTPKGFSHCGHCGIPQSRKVVDTPAIHIFEAGYYEHIDLNPVYCGSRKQLQNETRRRGQVSLYAED